jgi:hypothetical protein
LSYVIDTEVINGSIFIYMYELGVRVAVMVIGLNDICLVVGSLSFVTVLFVLVTVLCGQRG